jgi:hypothetical protein
LENKLNESDLFNEFDSLDDSDFQISNDEAKDIIETIEVPMIEETRAMTSLTFKDFPRTVQYKILSQSAITLLINVIFILLSIFIQFRIELLIILFILDLFLIGNIKYIYDSFKYIDCKLFEGFVVNIEFKGLPGTSGSYKSITLCDENSEKFITFDYYGKAKIGMGFPALLYMNKYQEITMKNDMPYIKNILAVTFGSNKDIEELESNSKIDVEDYFGE